MKKSIISFVFVVFTSFNCFGQNPILGEIRLFAGKNPPPGWAFCEGQVLKSSDFLQLERTIDTNIQ